MDWTTLLLQAVSGAVGGNIAAVNKTRNLGPLLNTILGVVGGVGGGQLAGGTLGGLVGGGTLGTVSSSGVLGLLLPLIVSFFKKKA